MGERPHARGAGFGSVVAMGVPWWVWPQSVVWVLAHWYLWLRLVRDTTASGGPARKIGAIALGVVALLVPGALIGMHALSPEAGAVLTRPGFTWFAVLVFLLSIFVPLELVRAVWTVARRIRRRRTGHDAPVRTDGADGAEEGRRRFLARGVALGAGIVSAGLVGYGMPAALGPPRVRRARIRIAQLAPEASGLRIALVADTHLGVFLGEDDLRRVVGMVNDAEPDVVVLGGDLVDGSVADLRAALAPLRDLRSTHGTFAVTGNHEYLFDADAWEEQLGRLGVRMLRNTRVALPHIDLAGVSDESGGRYGDPPDYDRALSGRDRTRPVVLAAHQPVQVERARTFGVDLQLSGHTHGGQYFPVSLLTAVRNPMLGGLYRIGRGPTQLYVTRGAGFWGPPVRIGADPEITVLDLVPDGTDHAATVPDGATG